MQNIRKKENQTVLMTENSRITADMLNYPMKNISYSYLLFLQHQQVLGKEDTTTVTDQHYS